MTITPTAPVYEHEKTILDLKSLPYFEHVVLSNGTITATGAIKDVVVGPLTALNLQAWISGFTGGTSPTITFSIQDLNVATYQAQLGGQSTTVAQETMGASDTSSALSGAGSVAVGHNTNLLSSLCRVSATVTGAPTSVNNVYVVLVGKPATKSPA